MFIIWIYMRITHTEYGGIKITVKVALKPIAY